MLGFMFGVMIVVVIVLASTGCFESGRSEGINFKLLATTVVFTLITIVAWNKHPMMNLFMGTITVVLWVCTVKIRGGSTGNSQYVKRQDYTSVNTQYHIDKNVFVDASKRYDQIFNKRNIVNHAIQENKEKVPTVINTTQVINNKYVIIGKNIYVQCGSNPQVLNNARVDEPYNDTGRI